MMPFPYALFPMPSHVPYGLRGVPSRLWPKCNRRLRWDAHEAQLRCPDEVDGDIYEHEVPGGALNLNYTKLPRPWSPRGSSTSRKNPHGRTGNRSGQKLWPLDHEAGLPHACNETNLTHILRLLVLLSLLMLHVTLPCFSVLFPQL
jgi:hypothetical protein